MANSRGLCVGVTCIGNLLILLLLIFVCTVRQCHGDCTLIEYADDTFVREQEKQLLRAIEPLKGQQFNTRDKNYTYTVKICDTVDGQIGSVGALQHAGNANYILGTFDQADIAGGGGWIVLTYYNGSAYGKHCNGSERITEIMIMCDPSHLRGEFKMLAEKRRNHTTHCVYMFELKSSVACTVPANEADGKVKGLSSGSVFCILFFTFFGMYLILGFLYKRLVVGAKGFEQIPNYGFWREFGNLQADACDFVCRCGPRHETHAYRGIDGRLKEEEERDDQLLNM